MNFLHLPCFNQSSPFGCARGFIIIINIGKDSSVFDF